MATLVEIGGRRTNSSVTPCTLHTRNADYTSNVDTIVTVLEETKHPMMDCDPSCRLYFPRVLTVDAFIMYRSSGPSLVPPLSCIHSLHVNHTPNAVARSHRAEALVDLIECLAVRDEFVDLEFAVFVILDQSAHLRSPFHAAEGTASPYAACYELESWRIVSQVVIIERKVRKGKTYA